MNVAQQLAQHWHNQPNLRLCPPPDESRIKAIERARGVRLPPDFRDYLTIADGFDPTNGYQDENGFTFWPLEKVESVSTYDDGALAFEGSDNYFIFADYLDFSWGYAIRLSDENGQNNVAIIGTATGQPQIVADSFSEFASIYLKDDARLYPL